MADSYRVTLVDKASGNPLSLLQGTPAISPTAAAQPARVSREGYFTGGWPMPQMNTGMLFRDVGVSGLRQYGGWVREEFLPQLMGRQASRTYGEMINNSSVIGSILFAITATLRKVEWRVEPADDTPAAAEAAEFVEGLMDDCSHTWTDFIMECQSKLGYGFAPMEIVYKRRLGREPGADPMNPRKQLPKSKYDDGFIGWRRLPLRGQDTVIKWFFDENGSIQGMTQQPWIGPLVDIPIEKMLLFRPKQHKNNPEGVSILRTAYRSYYLAKRLEEQEAIIFERLAGYPVIKIPNQVFELADAGDTNALAKLEAFKTIVRNVRIDEQMGLVIPSDMWESATGGAGSSPQYDFQLVAPQGRINAVDSDKSINRYNINMMTATMSDFLQLGHGARGTQALATSKVDMFFQAIEGWLNSDADVINRFGLPRLWDLNGFDHDLLPRIVPDLAQRMDLDVLSNTLLRLSQAGMPLFPDQDLEDWARDAMGAPGRPEDLDGFLADHLNNVPVDETTGTAVPVSAQQAAAGGMQQRAIQSAVKSMILRKLRKSGRITVNTRSTRGTAKAA